MRQKRKNNKLGEIVPGFAVERAYDFIRGQTISFGIMPGERINEVELAARLGMSRAPVREALNRLVVTGLIAFEPWRGFFCRKLNPTELIDLHNLRGDLEIAAVYEVCETLSDELLADGLSGLIEELGQAAANRSSMSVDDYVDMDERVHDRVVALSGNAERRRFLNSITDRVKFVRQMHFENPDTCAIFFDEHIDILKAVAARDGERAERLIRVHLKSEPAWMDAVINQCLAKIYADDLV